VSQRTQEIGIRMALGARPGQVLATVLREGMGKVVIGVALGRFAALRAARLLRTLLFGVSSYDPMIYAATIFGILGVGLLANLVPARRAATVDRCGYCIPSNIRGTPIFKMRLPQSLHKTAQQAAKPMPGAYHVVGIPKKPYPRISD
jgi:hypothetical protein